MDECAKLPELSTGRLIDVYSDKMGLGFVFSK